MHALVLQCGGPTAVVNTSLAALVRQWRASMPGCALSGGHHALRALLTADWRTLTDAGTDSLAAVEGSSGMALGGGRDRLNEAEMEQGIALLAARGVETLFLIGPADQWLRPRGRWRMVDAMPARVP
jgi:6-phosphofructokinase